MKIKTRDTNSRFKMKLTQTVGEFLGIPEEEYHATVKMPQARLAKICKDLSSIGDSVELEMSVSNEVVKFSALGESGTAKITCRHNITVDKPEEATSIDMEEPASLTISLSNMTSLVAAIPSTSQVIINLSSNSHLPVVIEYRVAEMRYVGFFRLASHVDVGNLQGSEGENEVEV
ncbi:proliferating cell nuclear antigen-like [Pyrus communis]|uniref:proliferating cell nuclear antigen-like n=1 Tax=Pyrus communis TaxID=23211 RepID=UPI0035C0622C